MMDENRFKLAAFASIAAAVMLPTAFIIAGIEGVAFELGAIDHAVGIGVADFLLLILGATLIYVLVNIKKLMYERYSYNGLDLIITIAIIWTIINYGGSFVIESSLLLFSHTTDLNPTLLRTVFWIACIAGFAIIDIIFGIVLILQRHRFSWPLKAFAVLSLLSGIFEATIVLSFITLIFYPMALAALAIAFFKPEEVVEII